MLFLRSNCLSGIGLWILIAVFSVLPATGLQIFLRLSQTLVQSVPVQSFPHKASLQEVYTFSATGKRFRFCVCSIYEKSAAQPGQEKTQFSS